MNSLTVLETTLLDLLYELGEEQPPFILAGGYGVYRLLIRARQRGERTLLSAWPEERSTNDLDLFLRPEVLLSPLHVDRFAHALDTLGFTPVKGSEYYQFSRRAPGAAAGVVKIDLLTGPRAWFAGTHVHTDSRRARPRPSSQLHAHPVEEALTLVERVEMDNIEGTLSTGANWHAVINLPQMYTFLLMKIFAFADRHQDAAVDYGRHHVLDMYAIMAATSESQWRSALELKTAYSTHPTVLAASAHVGKLFPTSDSIGMLRLRESPYYRDGMDVDEFLSILHELFPPAGQAHGQRDTSTRH